MNTSDSIKDVVRSYIMAHFPAAQEQSIRDDSPLLEFGIVDSLGVLDIIAHLESRFDIQISDEELEVEDFESIEALSDFVQRKLGCTSSN